MAIVGESLRRKKCRRIFGLSFSSMKSSWVSRSPTIARHPTVPHRLATWFATARMPPANFLAFRLRTASVGSFDDLPMASHYSYSSMIASPTTSTFSFSARLR